MKKLILIALSFVAIINTNAQTGIPTINNLNNPNSLLMGLNPYSLMSGLTPAAASQLQMMGIDPSSKSSIMSMMGMDTTSVKKQKTTSSPPPSSSSNTTTSALYSSGLTPEMITAILQATQMMNDANEDSIKNAAIEDYKTQNDTSNKQSKYFGHDYFQTSRLKLFEKSSDLKAPDSYTLDSGDELIISVWGFSEYNDKSKIDDNGYFQVSNVGRLYLRGQTLGAAKSLIRDRVSKFVNLNSSTLEVSLNFSRNLTVNIVGEVYKPGTYEIPAINSVFNALNAADGVTDLGSVRNIEVRRDGKIVKKFDLYDFLLNGNQLNDFYLRDGDFIYVPTAKKLVEINGTVRRPRTYELLDNENLPELIRFTGGLAANAYTSNIQLKRYNTTLGKVEITDFSLDDVMSGKMKLVLQDGDQITVPVIPEDYDNFITITGAIKLPGKYQYKEGYRISDLLKIAGGILPSAYLDRGYLYRKMEDLTQNVQSFSLKNIILDENSPENVLLQKQDIIDLFFKEQFKEIFQVSIEGSVKRPVKKEWAEGLSLNDLIFYGGGLKLEAANNRIEISRVINLDSVNGNTIPTRIVVKTVEVGPNLEIDDASKSFQLNPMDQVFVRKINNYNEQMNVSLFGEVNYPGNYSILSKDERVLDLILRAGGLTDYAYVEGAKLTRTNEGIGKVILDLKEAFKDPNSIANYILKENDVITIPTLDQLVRVRGAIRYPGLDSMETIAGKYVPGKSAKYYVKKYGVGFNKRAKKKSTVSLFPNGGADYTKYKFLYRDYPTVRPGTIITVDFKPSKPEVSKEPRERLNWNIILPAIITSIASAASTVVLYYIISK